MRSRRSLKSRSQYAKKRAMRERLIRLHARSCRGTARECTLIEILARTLSASTLDAFIQQRRVEGERPVLSMAKAPKRNRQLVEDLCAGHCSSETDDCLIKAVFMSCAQSDPRTLMQVKCMEWFYAKSKPGRKRQAVSLSRAAALFLKTGLADVFRHTYNPQIRIGAQYSRLMKEAERRKLLKPRRRRRARMRRQD